MTAGTIGFTHAATGTSLRILRSAVKSEGSLLESEAAYPSGSVVPPPHVRREIQVTSPPAWVQGLLFGALAPLSRRLGRCPELRSAS